MRSITAFAVALCMACTVRSQYDGPESVEYDAAGDRYFISNTGDNTIKQRDQSGTVAPFVSVSPPPYGLEIQGDTLFACSGGSVKGYLLSTGAQVFNLNLGGTFCNGITSDGTYLYVTDFTEQKIYRVDVAANSFITWVADTDGTPNGIAFDFDNARLMVAFWGSNAPLKAYDVSTAALLTTYGTSLGNIDGITIDCMARFIISSWSPNGLWAVENDLLSAPVNLGVTGLNHPADVDYDAVHAVVGVPNAGNNTVVVIGLPDCGSGLRPMEAYQEVHVIPNPTTGLVRLTPSPEEATDFLLLDQRGLLIGGGTLPSSGLIDVSGLSAGRYIIDIPELRMRAQLLKE
jgi:DNA-binding beta-propeller fold protein YncE